MSALDFLKTYGWIGLLAALVIAVPILIGNLQEIPPPDRETLLAYMLHHEERIFEEYGPPLPERYFELMAQLEETDPPTLTVGSGMGTAGLDTWTERYGHIMSELNQLDRQGIANRPLEEAIAERTPETWWPAGRPNYLLIQTRARIHRNLALRAMENGDWDEALLHLKHAAYTGTPVQVHSLIGHLIAVATRTMAYGGYMHLLAYELPEQVIEQTLADLEELSATDPDFDTLARVGVSGGEMTGWLLAHDTIANGKQGERLDIPFTYRAMYLAGAHVDAVEARDRLQSSSLRRYADRRRRTVEESEDLPEDLLPRLALRWTAIPGMVRFLKTVARDETVLYEDLAIPEELLEQGDRWTLAVYLSQPFLTRPNLEVASTRNRMMMTHRALVVEALEARLHYKQTGEWPEVPPLEEPEVLRILAEDTQRDTGPYQPLQWRRLDGTPSLLQTAALVAQKTPVMYPSQRAFSVFEQDGETRFMAGFPTSLPADYMLSLPGQFEPFAENVQATIRPPWMTRSADIHAGQQIDPALLEHPPPDTVRSGDRENWEKYLGEDAPIPAPLTAEYAERMASVHADPGEHPRDLLHFAERVLLIIEGDLKLPEEPRILWSPGPDGLDGGGKIPYDPTNGTLSAGDIIVFPERFQ